MRTMPSLFTFIMGSLVLSWQPAWALGQGDLTTASYEEVLAQPVVSTGRRIAYGQLPQQFGMLRVPPQAGVHPVVMLIHGGCWLADYDFSYVEALAAALTARGYATWNIEYRRVGDEGGGWPGTSADVWQALQFLRMLAPRYSLDLSALSLLGHSSGGQLALWLGAEHGRDLPIRSVLSLAGITDLRTYRRGSPGSCHSAVDGLMGGAPDLHPDRYAAASPMARLPLGVMQFIVQGRGDHVVSPDAAQRYARAARQAGDAVQLIEVEGGHFDVVMARGPVFEEICRVLAQPPVPHGSRGKNAVHPAAGFSSKWIRQNK